MQYQGIIGTEISVDSDPVHLNRVPAAKKKLFRGQRIGKYRLEKRLGSGGYCEVWRAKDTVEGIKVALKIPLLGVNGMRDSRAILREVRLVSQLRHPNILPVKNADIIDGYAILATELSAGTLDDRSRPMAVKKIVLIMRQVLEGLAYAHLRHVIHCDVTPSNIFLFPQGRVSLGDFGIGLQVKRHMVTVDEFGTPGYVAPEQAYGKPTYRSDCFSVGLILYEFLTGILPRWPFRQPLRGTERLQDRTNAAMVRFMRQALALDPARRFANASEMLKGLYQALPRVLQGDNEQNVVAVGHNDWRKLRRLSFIRRYKRVFTQLYRCCRCGELIAESMAYCPWCGTDRNRFDKNSRFEMVCPDCHKGILPEWHYCPWCYGPGFISPAEVKTPGIRYHARCEFCGGKLMRFMRYCPWCRRKVRQKWQVGPFFETCLRCGWPVDTNFWNYCPWCRNLLLF